MVQHCNLRHTWESYVFKAINEPHSFTLWFVKNLKKGGVSIVALSKIVETWSWDKYQKYRNTVKNYTVITTFYVHFVTFKMKL